MINKDKLQKDLKLKNEEIEYFIEHAKRYIKAIKEGRVVCSIGSVAKSGMSRTFKFVECTYNKYSKNYQYLNFWFLFEKMGYSTIDRSDYFRIYGCGMDMIFEANYRAIHRLHKYGFMTKKQRDILAQRTPTVI